MGARGSQEARKNVQSSESISNSFKPLENTDDTSRVKLVSPLKMPMSNIYKCGRCGMTFSTDEALYKHRMRFCLGAISSNTGRLHYSDDEDLNQTTARTTLKYSSPIDKVMGFSVWKLCANGGYVARNEKKLMNGKINDPFCRVYKIWKIELYVIHRRHND